MNHRVAVDDIFVELGERASAEILKFVLLLHMNIMPREIDAKLLAIGAKLVRDAREKNRHRHFLRARVKLSAQYFTLRPAPQIA